VEKGREMKEKEKMKPKRKQEKYLGGNKTKNISGKVNMEHQLDSTITVLLISNISSTCFWQIFAHLQERKTEIFTKYGIMSC
jgi:hypothetical protein